MAGVITLKGIDQAISNLDYLNRNALKYRFVHTIRQYYTNEDSVESMLDIDTDELVKVLWNTGDDLVAIKNRHRNLSSIRSSVNADLKKLYEEGNNPEGIAVGPANIFILSNEARNKVLEAFKDRVEVEGAVTLSQITDILDIVNEILSRPEAIVDTESAEGSGKLDQLKNVVQGLSEKLGLRGTEPADSAAEASMAMSGEKESTGQPDLAEVTEELEEVPEDDAIIAEEDELEEVAPKEETVPDEAEEVEEAQELEEDEAIEDVEDVEVEEAAEEAEVEEGLEEVDDVLEEVEEVESEDDLEEAGEVEEGEEADISGGDLGAEYTDGDYGEDDEITKARPLAEEFNNLLSAKDRFYNQYIPVPEGEYIVGSKRPKKDGKGEQRIQLPPFYMSKFPLTNALFETFVEKTGYMTTAEKLGYGMVYYGRFKKKVDKKTGLERLTWNSGIMSKTVEGACWYQPSGPGSTLHNKRNHPVVQVSSEDAMAFAAWTGKRLPTEDEWEAASRTAHGYVFPWGEDWKKESCNIEESRIGDTTPVDKYIEFANDFEIVDPMGNVLEWTSDSAQPPSSVKSGPDYFVAKGGSWISGNDIRLFSRFKLEPESHSNILGFRCVAY